MTATRASREFSALLDRIEREGDEVTITRDGRPVAVVSPARRSAVAAFDAFLSSLPRLDDDFASAVAAARPAPSLPEDPWAGA